MNFLHLSLLAGLAAVSVPIVLHLLGNREPKQVDFPAIRFVRAAQLEQSASWQLRHFLLLLLRILLLGLLVLALARPRVHSAVMGSIVGVSLLSLLAGLASLVAAVAWASHRPKAVWGTALGLALALWIGSAAWGYRALNKGPALPQSDLNAPIAAVFIVDTSPSMAYQSNNQTRLDAAKEMATWLLDRMPIDSHVGVLTGAPLSSLSLNPSAAESQIDLIEETTQRVDLPARLRTALDLVSADELERKEIYVLTDLNSPAWASVQSDLSAAMEPFKESVLVQIIDVGVSEPRNWQLGDPDLDFATIPAGGDVALRIPVSQFTPGGSENQTVTVELWKEAIDPRLPVLSQGKLQLPESSVVAREVVEFDGDGTVEVELNAKNLEEGIHHFTIRLDKNDPLSIDNSRYVTVSARRLQPTLVVADDPEVRKLLKLIVDPREIPPAGGESPVTGISYAQLPQAILTRYSVVVLHDPPTLGPTLTQSLSDHVFGGKGLFLILGPNLESVAGQLESSAIAELLPGLKPKVVRRPQSDRSVFWQPTAQTHPIYQELGIPADEIAWQLLPVFESWNFESLKGGVQVLAELSNGDAPLLTAQTIGRGQIITLLTPIPELEQTQRRLWNELWIAEQYWWAFGIVSGSIKALSGADQTPLVFSAAYPVKLSNDTTEWPKRWDLYTPDGQRIAIESQEGMLSAGTFFRPGIYRLRGTLGVPVTRGFSVNIPAADTTFQKADRDQLDAVLGADSYHVAKSKEEVESSVGQARFGSELYPLLMLFVAGLFLAEQVMSNRFYQFRLRVGQGGQ
jgi:hypothetical protein